MTKYAAFGTELQRGNGADPEVFAAVGQVRSFDGPSESADQLDVTTHDSPGDYREKLPSFLDAGEVTLEVLWDPALISHVNLRTDLRNKTRRNFRMVWPDTAATTESFAAYVTGYSRGAPHDAELTASITLLIDGPVT